jgi:hypothetical protein
VLELSSRLVPRDWELIEPAPRARKMVVRATQRSHFERSADGMLIGNHPWTNDWIAEI